MCYVFDRAPLHFAPKRWDFDDMTPSKDDWSILILPNSNRKYYYNTSTGESRWDLQRVGGPYSRPLKPSPIQTRSVSAKAQRRTYHQLHDGFDSDSKHHHQQTSRQSAFLTPPRVNAPFQDQPRHTFKPPKPLEIDSSVVRHRKSNSYAANSDTRWLPDHSIASSKSMRPMMPNPKRMSLVNNYNDAVHLLQSTGSESKPHNYNKDYIRLSREYKRMQPFRPPMKSSAGHRPICIICQSRSQRLDKVLFPCEHCCICNVCLKSALPKQCPLCNETIRAAFELDNAHENYWNWVEEVSVYMLSDVYLIASTYLN